ncbi:hypothetical protein GCM10023196_069600 [Actinoallomurus vinaceus]|uniref:Uncharacterized protein n=1 Tax=Actinoallomurus vinaceus TaxID=1080074 RepID=A0ABP8UJN3_9ACTN
MTGLGFSAPAVDQAGALAAELGLDARFVTADVYDAMEAPGRRTYDIIYTGLGALKEGRPRPCGPAGPLQSWMRVSRRPAAR